MEEDMQRDASDGDLLEVFSDKNLAWERKLFVLRNKVSELERLKTFMEEFISNENWVGKYKPLINVKDANPTLVKYLERQLMEGEVTVSEIMEIGVRCLETSKNRMVLFSDYMNYTNYEPQPSSLSDVECLNDPELVIKVENMGQKQGPFSMRTKELKLTGYAEKARVNLEYTADNKFRITTKFVKLYPAPRLTYVLKDQPGSEGPRDVVRPCPARFKLEECGWDNVTYSRSFLVKGNYEWDEEVAIEIHVESPEEKNRAFSETGTLLWTVDRYWKRKQEEKDGLVKYHLSPCFKTSGCHYRVQVKMYLNGYRKLANKRWKCRNEDKIKEDDNEKKNEDENQEKDEDENQEKDEDENQKKDEDEKQKKDEDKNQEKNEDKNQEKDEDENQEKDEDENQEKDEDENLEKSDEELKCKSDEDVTIRMLLLMGDFDCIPDFLPHKVTVTVFNPDDPSQRISQSKIVESVKRWKSFHLKIGTQKEIENALLNDTLYYQVSVTDES